MEGPPQPAAGPSDADWKAAKWFAIGVSAVAALLILASAVKIQITGDGRLVVVASAEAVPDDPKQPDKGGTWTVRGHVSEGSGGPAEGVSVTLVALTKHGETRPFPSLTTDGTGAFAIPKVKKDDADPVREFQIAAFKRTPWYQLDKHGRYTWGTNGSAGSIRTSDVGFGTGFTIPPICFALSLLLVAFFSIQDRVGKSYHFVPCVLAIVATVSMVVLVGYGIRWVNEHFEAGQPASFGFVTFHQGTYVKGGCTDWLVSLTKPLTPAAEAAAVKPAEPVLEAGLGAPLWVVFISVLGSGLLTIVLVIGETLVPLPTDNSAESREKVQKRFRGILEHQFFVLFSPLAGIIIYQIMVTAGAAGQPVVVAMAVLGAGAALNGLLARAVKLAEGWIQKGSEERPMAGGPP
ncbi:MAG: hypothetical protein U0791_01060 [Gemmataceae bacterium]